MLPFSALSVRRVSSRGCERQRWRRQGRRRIQPRLFVPPEPLVKIKGGGEKPSVSDKREEICHMMRFLKKNKINDPPPLLTVLELHLPRRATN